MALWRRVNIARCLAAALACLAMADASAQPAADAPAAPATLSPAPPSPQVAMAAYQRVEGWVRAWQEPEPDAASEAFAAASVVLRLGGQILGRGTDASGQDSLARAAREALREARERLPAPRDAVSRQLTEELASQVMISLELAGPLVPFEPADYADADALVAPGLEGVAARFGTRVEAMFPATMMATATTAASALRAMVSKAADDPPLGLKRPAELRESHAATFYRFRVTHLAQPAPGASPVFLHRGGRVVPRGSIGMESLRRFAEAMARHLVRRCDAAPEGAAMAGSLDPIRGVFDGEAGAADSALAAFALLRYARAPGVDPAASRAATGTAVTILTTLATSIGDDLLAMQTPDGRAVAAIAYLAASELMEVDPGAFGHSPLAILHDGVQDALLHGAPEPPDAKGADAGAPAWREWPEEVWREPGAGLLACALARAAVDGGGRAERDHAEAAVRAVYRATPPDMLVGRMPWLGWAELTLAQGRDEVPAAAALRHMRDLLWQHQLTPADLPPDSPDLEGGIVFTASRAALPSWHSARPVAFAATMLGEARLTGPDERTGELLRLASALRFLRQLQADEAAAYLYADAGRALGGVRSALWDPRMPVEATAMGLLAASEMLASLERISSTEAGPGGGVPGAAKR